ncbi:MAG: lipoprotein signal peptidase [Bacteroidota bacterium]|nr:lipoprotein signal peptidase [Bacteroidota bacterium]
MVKIKGLRLPLLIVFLVLLIDQTIKIYIKTHFLLGEEHVVTKWFIIHFIENPGMAFGMQFSGDWGKLMLSLFRIVAVGFISWYMVKLVKQNAPKGLIVCIALIVAGAAGNIIDSAFYGLIFNESSYFQVATLFPPGGGYTGFLHGQVVDMLYFPIFNGTFPQWLPVWGGERFLFFSPVFNIADSSITTGVLAILVFQRSFFGTKKLHKEEENEAPEEDIAPAENNKEFEEPENQQ